MPDSLTPPKGATSVEMMPVLMPTIPLSMASATRHTRQVRRVDHESLFVHAAVQNLFNFGRHLVRAEHYRNLREGAFGRWAEAVA
jgi:hypothetical protein